MQIHDLNTGTPAATDVLAMDTGSDTYKTTPGNIVPSYTSGDSSTATSWTSVTAVASGLSFSTLIGRITTMMKNVRYLYGLLGTTDISGIGGGTVTGAISALGGKISSGTSVSISDFITASTGVTLASSGHVIYKTENHIYAKLMFTGAITSNAAGYFNVGTLKTAYCPTAPQAKGVVINNTTGGQVRGPATVEIFAGGTIRIATGANAATYGNSSYPWSTDTGILIDYAL